MVIEARVEIYRSGNPGRKLQRHSHASILSFFRRKCDTPKKKNKAITHGRNAIALYNKGKYSEAIEECNVPISAGNGNSVTYGMRAYSRIMLKQYALAIPDLEKAASLCSPGKKKERKAIVDAAEWLSFCHMHLGDYEKAVECANAALALDPGHKNALKIRDAAMRAIAGRAGEASRQDE